MVGILPLTALGQPEDDHEQGPPDDVPAADVCPEEGKVESQVDGELDNIILEEGTLVCIKGGQATVQVVADGNSTLAEMLGTGQNVSHYTIISVPPTTTTTTSIPKETTTTVRETTTTTEEGTTTTNGETSTTVPNEEETTSSIPPSTTTLPSPTEEVVEEEPAALPFTGVGGLVPLSGLALALLASGGLVLRREIR
jgi:hypothetical protein